MAMLDDGRQLYFSWFLDDGQRRFTHPLGRGGRRYAVAAQLLASLLVGTLIALITLLGAAWHSQQTGHLQDIALVAMLVATAALVAAGATTACIQFRRPGRGRNPTELRVVRWPSLAFQVIWATSFAILALGLFALMQAEASFDPFAAAVETTLVSLSLLFAVRVRSVWKASRAEPQPRNA